MTAALLAGITGLALLDSLNPATIVAITLILLSPMRRPVPASLAFVAGAAGTVFVLGLGILLSAGAATNAISGGIAWLRRIAFTVAAVALLVSAARRLRDRPRSAPALPSWFSARTALPLGVVMTGADLPNAFPYFIAIERLIAAEVPLGLAAATLAGYAVIYCLPCLILLGLGVTLHERVRPRLDRLYRRLGTGVAPRSPAAATGLTLAAITVGYFGWTS